MCCSVTPSEHHSAISDVVTARVLQTFVLNTSLNFPCSERFFLFYFFKSLALHSIVVFSVSDEQRVLSSVTHSRLQFLVGTLQL